VAPHTGHQYEFGPFRLEPDERRLLRHGEKVPLAPKAFEVLALLVTRAGHVVTKEELLRGVWAGTFVEEGNLSYTVSQLRRALQAESGEEPYIETVQKLGYRFTGPVQMLAPDGVPLPPTSTPGAPGGPHEEPAVSAPSDSARLGRWLRNRRRGLAAVAVSVVVLGLAAAILFRQTRQVAPSPVARFDVTLPADITLFRFDQPVISPDGRRIAFTGVSGAMRQLWVQPLAGPTAIALPGTEGAMWPFWSPDSRRVAFYVDQKLKTIDVDGGSLTTVCGGLHGPAVFSGAWGSGVIIFSSGPVYRVAEKGGTPEAITRVDPSERRHFVSSFLSDGRRFLFRDMQVPQNVYVASLDAPNEKRRLKIGSLASPIRALTVSRGHLLYAQQGALVVQAFDEDALEVRGTPITLAETDGTPWQPRPSVSQTGMLVFRSTGEAKRQLTIRGRDGSHLGVAASAGLDTQVDLSPSGTQAILVRGGPWPEDRDLYRVDLRTGLTSILTARAGLDSDPAWSPDENRIAYSSSRDGTIVPFVKDLDTGKESRLLDSRVGVVVDDWTPDDRLIVRNHGLQVFALPIGSERKLQLLADTPYSEDQLQVSTDGSIAFNSTESGSWEVWVARFSEGFPGKRQVSQGGGVQPRWRQDGRELFYLAADGTMMAVERIENEVLAFGAARPLFKTPLNPADPGWSEYDVTPNGQRFLILEPIKGAPPKFTFVVNWSDALKR
jgi:eukaryotic-like serine/threonine-protein kinase